MKKLLLFLLLIPAWAKAQTPITPSWTRQATQIGILDTVGMSYSGQVTKQYFGSTAWVRRYMINKSDTSTFSATRYWTEHQPHVWYGNQTINGNVIISGTGNQLIMDNGSLLNGSDGFVISTNQRNGFQVFYYGTNIFSVAGTGHAADMPYLYTSLPVRISAVQGGLDYGVSGYNVLVKDNGTLGGSGTFGYVKEVPLSSFTNSGHQDTINQTKADSARLYNGSQSIYRNASTTFVSPDSLAFFTDSYGIPTGPNYSYQGYTKVASGILNAIEKTIAVGGSTVEFQTPNSPFGTQSFIERQASIPIYNSKMIGLVVEGGINDLTLNSANYNTTNFTTDLTSFINYAHNTKGWPYNKILIISPPYLATYFSRNGNPAANSTIHQAFVASAKSVATSLGTLYFDAYNAGKAQGASIMASDNLHQNGAGHRILAGGVVSAFGYTIKQNGQKLAINGLVELNKLKLNITDTLKTNNVTTIGLDSLNNVVLTPNRFIAYAKDTTSSFTNAGNININGGIKGAYVYSNNDISGLTQTSRTYLNLRDNSFGLGSLVKNGYYNTSLVGVNYQDEYNSSGVAGDIRLNTISDGNVILNNTTVRAAKTFTVTSGLTSLGAALQISGSYPTTKPGLLATSTGNIGFIDSYSTSSPGTGVELRLNNLSTGAVNLYGNTTIQGVRTFTVNSGNTFLGGKLSVHMLTTPTAWLHLDAGVAGATGAPLKFTSGTNLTTPEAGAIEFDGTDLYYTTSTPTRRTVVNLAAAQTLTNKTLTSPQINTPLLNTTSVVGQIWTATNTTGAGNWASPSSVFSTLLTAPNNYSTSATPTISVGANAGTGATVSIVGNNQDGIITVNTGTGATTGVLCTITMSGSFAYPNSCTPVITPLLGPLITGEVLIDTPTTTGWGIYMNGGVVSSSTYKWTYHNGGY